MEYAFEPTRPSVVPLVGSDRVFPVRRVFCVGSNFREHALEMGATGREPPFFFMKPSDAIVAVPEGATGAMPYPSLSTNLHPEVELVVAVGRGGRDIAAIDALAHVFGYAVGLDMTRRDLQNEMRRQGRPWDIAKAFDDSAAVGAITPAERVPQVHHARLSLLVNDEGRQSSRVDRMIWNVAEVIAHLSMAWALAPGDLIYTGTPEGVAAVQPGDLLDARVEGLSPLRLRILP